MEPIFIFICMLMIIVFLLCGIIFNPKQIEKEIIGAEVQILIIDYFKEQIDKVSANNNLAEIDNILKYNKEIQILLKKKFEME